MHGAHSNKQETSITRTSKFAVTLIVFAVTSLASTAAFAHGGGGFGGGFSGSGGRGFGGSISAPVGYAHGPTTVTSIARSPVIARIPKADGHKIPTISQIAKDPRRPLPPSPGNNNNNNNKPGWGPGTVVGPAGGVVDVPVDVGGGDVTGGAAGTVGTNSQAVQAPRANCDCLTKQYLDDGSLLFRDLCTKETVLVTPAELKAQAKNLAR